MGDGFLQRLSSQCVHFAYVDDIKSIRIWLQVSFKLSTKRRNLFQFSEFFSSRNWVDPDYFWQFKITSFYSLKHEGCTSRILTFFSSKHEKEFIVSLQILKCCQIPILYLSVPLPDTWKNINFEGVKITSFKACSNALDFVYHTTFDLYTLQSRVRLNTLYSATIHDSTSLIVYSDVWNWSNFYSTTTRLFLCFAITEAILYKVELVWTHHSTCRALYCMRACAVEVDEITHKQEFKMAEGEKQN